MAPSRGLPLNCSWDSEDDYIQSLLTFANNSDIFRNLCGGIHILDFLTREPDLYKTVLPSEWRAWFEQVSIDNVLDVLLRDDLERMQVIASESSDQSGIRRGLCFPPSSLVEYIGTVRKHCLDRQYKAALGGSDPMPRHIAVGMKPKKIHEVTNFAAYIGNLAADVAGESERPVSIVDFGSGQNYLGRTLASPPHNKDVVAIERKHHNIDGAKGMDIYAKLAKKDVIMRNKKEFKKEQASRRSGDPSTDCTPPYPQAISLPVDHGSQCPMIASATVRTADAGSMTYIEHEIEDGKLENVLYPSNTSSIPSTNLTTPVSHSPDCTVANGDPQAQRVRPELMVVSLHSCGNLIHHGLRSLVLNPSVTAVAMIGCCYNLMTERLGPATYKLPTLRPNHPRLEATSSAFDPHGFPMSRTLEEYEHKHGRGVRLNITARMMAVQAPYNWGPEDSEAFFKRHFYRALLQRILLDRGVVQQCSDPDSVVGGSISGKDTSGTPLIVGTLRKSCFTSFRAYVRGALAKLVDDPVDGQTIRDKTRDITDEVIDRYEAEWGNAKKTLAVIWSLMAFSAGVVESIIAVDRWLFLKEQDCVEKCWVEPVFDYKLSPRNLAVVGIKKRRQKNS